MKFCLRIHKKQMTELEPSNEATFLIAFVYLTILAAFQLLTGGQYLLTHDHAYCSIRWSEIPFRMESGSALSS